MIKRCCILTVLFCLLLAGCAEKTQVPDLTPAKSDRLVIYTSHKEDVYTPILREFEARTGIWVELVTGGTSELLNRIDQEKNAPRADIMFGGGVESLESYRELFVQAECPNSGAIAKNLFRESDPWTPFSALPMVLVYNPKLVDSAKLTGWADLQNPEFAGKIAMADPTKSGSSFTAVVTCLYACGEEVMAGVARNLKGAQLSSSGDVLGMVESGACLVGITLEETALKRIAAGDNLALVYPIEGTSCVPDGTAVVKGAPHPENAAKFLEFTLCLEVQELLGSRFCRRAVRSDVPSPQSLIPMESIALLDYDTRWAAEHRQEVLNQWAAAVQEGAK